MFILSRELLVVVVVVVVMQYVLVPVTSSDVKKEFKSSNARTCHDLSSGRYRHQIHCLSVAVVFWNLLRAGRSGDRIPMMARFSAPVHTGS